MGQYTGRKESDMNKTITLTHDQATRLTSFLLMTTNYRKDEREAWESLAQEVKEDGSPEYPNAKGNARFWAGMEATIEEIIKIIDNAKLEG